MKKYLICFFLFCILTISLYIIPINAKGTLSGKVIVIDAGHGGVDPGTVVGMVYEKDINLKISLYLKDELVNEGAEVIMTRDGDYDLGTPKAVYRKKSDFDHRIKVINDSKANYYVSIHLNYLGDSKYYGPQVFYDDKDEYNEKMANIIQSYLNEKLQTLREIKKIPRSIYMYPRLNKRGVLIECGFLSNKEERKKLLDEEYLKEMARNIKEALKLI